MMAISEKELIEILQQSEINCSKEEFEYWKMYHEFMMSNYGDAYINSPYFQKELEAIGEFIEPKKGERWLDLGCGALPVSRLILDREPNVDLWAGDIILLTAKEKLKKMGNPPVKLVRLDLTKALLFEGNFFDGIVASKVLPYIPESQGKEGKEGLREIFREVFRILKPGGVLVWSGSIKDVSRLKGTLLALGYIFNVYQWIKQRCFLPMFAVKVNKVFKPVVEKIKKGIYPVFSVKEYEDLLNSVGFVNQEWKLTFGNQVLVNKSVKPV